MSQQHILQAQRLLAQARYKNNGHINQGRGLLKTMAWVGPMAPWQSRITTLLAEQFVSRSTGTCLIEMRKVIVGAIFFTF